MEQCARPNPVRQYVVQTLGEPSMDFHSHQLTREPRRLTNIRWNALSSTRWVKPLRLCRMKFAPFSDSFCHRLQKKSIHLDAVLSQEFSTREILRRAVGK
jgi:hypothetical protein